MDIKEMVIKTELGNALKWQPRIVIDHKLNRKMELIIDLIDTEVGWYGLVEWQKPDIFKVKDIYLLKQEVTGTFTEIDAMDLCNLEDELEKRGLLKEETLDTTGLYLWGHSHVNMDPSPSGTDTDTMKKICDRSKPPFFIRLIQNKKGNRTVTLYVEDKNSLVQNYALIYDVPWIETEDLGEDAVREELRKEINDKVQKRPVLSVPTTKKITPLPSPSYSRSTMLLNDNYDDFDTYYGYNDPYDVPPVPTAFNNYPTATVISPAPSSEVKKRALNRLRQTKKFGLPSRQ